MDLVTTHMEVVLDFNEYQTIKYGGSYPNFTCTECDANGMMVPTDKNESAYVCAGCNAIVGGADSSFQIDECPNCGEMFKNDGEGPFVCKGCMERALRD